jgi:hypothetical protein
LSPNNKNEKKKSMLETEELGTKFKNSHAGADSVSASFSGVGTKRIRHGMIPSSF